MLCSDAQANSSDNTFGNMNTINIYAITEIQKEIDPCDMISMVFLLYDVPDTALQRLVIYERVYKDSIGGSTSDLLHQWALHAQNRTTWKHEFLEALVTCQLNKIIRKLGFNVTDIKRNFEIDSGNTYLNPMKKLLYKLCENIELQNLSKLKNTLLTYNINTTDYENCELIFLDLMCRKFISFQQNHYGNRVTSYEYDVEKLADIIENFDGLEKFSEELRALNFAGKIQPQHQVAPVASTSNTKQDNKESNKNDQVHEEDLNESFDLIKKLMEDVHIDSLKSDKRVENSTVYDIKNPNKVGICYIINQEHFYPSKISIENKSDSKQLQSRIGSTKDKESLKETMSALNFEVITDDNLDHKTMINKIENILKYRVQRDHSIFILCILSHGTKGHIYAADSVRVKVETIENLLDCDGAKHLQGMPKVVIFQACQVNEEEQTHELIADAPKYYIKKSDILIYSATAPGYEAYRLEKYGSIFIQILCKVIEENADTAHLEDIFTKVTYFVHKICTKLRRDQLPKKETTLLKKLHLKKII
ncbi:caspase-8-like [Plodia interpunctella]|uniref:caspase-8-like n=1 Tax=Plodia interpunctella TaxID=58824 RepID=UPI0023679BA5|nr:caspase-8-like [Plodia interpunctella]